MFDILISLAVLGAIALAIGAVALFRRGQRKQAVLMAILVAVLAVNVAIWLVPDADGDTMMDAAARSAE